jgi:hypothetical protein
MAKDTRKGTRNAALLQPYVAPKVSDMMRRMMEVSILDVSLCQLDDVGKIYRLTG